jgi:hypothetical protein
MLPQRVPILNGWELTHAELRAIHANRRVAIHAATAKYCLDGPRLLSKAAGEVCKQRAVTRDREGCLLVEITVELPQAGAQYKRRVRLVPWDKTDRVLRVEVAREERNGLT